VKDHDLKTLLASVIPPEADEAARNRALHRATVALSQPGASATPDVDGRSGRRASYGWAVVSVIMLVAGLVMIRPFQPTPEMDGGADLRTLAQVEGLFPGQLNAVIEHDGEVQLDLAGQSSPGVTDQPVIVQLEHGAHRLRVLSYSGRSITLKLKDGTLTFEVLVTGEGTVVLSGNNFVWSSAQSGLLAGYKVQAHTLVSSL